MLHYRHIIRSLFLLGALLLPGLFTVFSCNKQPEDPFSPAAISGTWAVTQVNKTGEWVPQAIETVYDFDGTGKYTLRNCTGRKPSFEDGVIYGSESIFRPQEDKAYAVRSSGEEYRFESMSGTMTLESSDSNRMVFYYEDSSGVGRRLRFEKVLRFEASGDAVSERSINGTDIVAGNNLAGLVSDSQTGKGIPGVVVSDGYDCVRTDANGVYQFKSNPLTRIIYYSTPSGYKVSGRKDSPGLPVFYKFVSPKGNLIRTDFLLEPQPWDETSWTFVGIGDPQCATVAQVSRYVNESIPDLKQTIAGKTKVYAMTLGDVVYDSNDTYPLMRESMSSVPAGPGWTVPFFQTIGNHDHDGTVPDTEDDLMDDYNATRSFIENFGPTDYSFDRGKVHIVSMDNVVVTSQETTPRSNGRTWKHTYGYSDAQIAWLEKDLSFVENKQDKMLIFCSHVPLRNNSRASVQAVLKQLEAFKEVHLMIGHTHYTENVVYKTAHKTVGELPMYEHIHGSACGTQWSANTSTTATGEPSGYTVYEIEGAHIKDWKFKGTRKDPDFQLRVYDGNDVYYPEKYPVNWYEDPQKIGPDAFVIHGMPETKGCFVAQVFNDDDTYWSVDMVRKSTGEKIGTFTRIEHGYNAAMVGYWYNVKNVKKDKVGSISHYWYYKPASADPSSETDWEVVVTHTLPGGTATHRYTRSVITKQADLAKEFYL